ncbi:MAG: tetraacyldisaccharide 4'-kinase [Alphaproteobacteria bacterium]|nr:tetraacyldisaccharide 4'-kinase [Alphaproteobacteria bacterium]
MKLAPPGFWQGRSALDRALGAALSPLGHLYDGAGAARWARATPASAPVPVLCVGNLTLGGTGKTPLALALADRLRARGRKPGFLTRGYGGRLEGPLAVDPSVHGAREVGDEPLLLAASAPTILARDRVAGAGLAPGLGIDCLIMDDGFQNPALAKTACVLVIDAEAGLGNGRVFPAGPLREAPGRGLARADLVILMGEGPGPRILAGWPGPVVRARLAPAPDAVRFRGRAVVAFAGIGRPAKFFSTLTGLGARLAGAHALADHAVPGEGFLSRLASAAEAAGAVLVTTAKDAVRLSPAWRARVDVLEVTVELEEEGPVEALLDRLSGAAMDHGLHPRPETLKPHQPQR